ncbi:MAG: mannose-6-phosphate isomerase, class I [Cryobacterium sp.]|nr:mannose-6-phosphate isomerase, class I [Cryobacterium sp.]
MFAKLRNTPRYAAWGSTTAIAELLGHEPSGGPEAELWFGAHPISPAHFADGDGALPDLPFLLKVLAADKPLSLQAHPTAAQAQAGFDRENSAGIAVDAPERNYRDPHPKPELLVAVSERFDALAGFRPIDESRAIFAELSRPDVADRLGDLPAFVAWLLSRGEGVDTLVEQVSQHGFADDDTLRLVHDLSDDYPGDPGIVLALTLNRVRLQRGEALFVPAGCIHAYLSGVGMELMTASDNVLRGGLTVKNIDVPELLAVLDFTPGPAPRLDPTRVTPAHTDYHAIGTAPRLAHITGDARLEARGPAIALCTAGSFELTGSASSTTLERGEAVFVTGDEGALAVVGTGSLFVASADADSGFTS